MSSFNKSNPIVGVVTNEVGVAIPIFTLGPSVGVLGIRSLASKAGFIKLIINDKSRGLTLPILSVGSCAINGIIGSATAAAIFIRYELFKRLFIRLHLLVLLVLHVEKVWFQ